MLRFLTAGESHGKALVTIIEGVPAGLAIDLDAITVDLRRRQTGYGRGRVMAIESDRAEPLSGVRHGRSTGAPIALLIPNKDWENWQRTMYVELEMPAGAPGADRSPVTRPRPGHADLAGFVKYGHDDLRNVLERASARETAARVAVGSYVQWDRKLDGRLAQALMSIPAIKAVGIGRGPAVADVPGSRVHDEILPGAGRPGPMGVRRPTNNAGGLEGGVTNGEDLRITAYMKPISTLMKPL